MTKRSWSFRQYWNADAQELKVQNESEDEERCRSGSCNPQTADGKEGSCGSVERNQKRNCSIATVSFRFV